MASLYKLTMKNSLYHHWLFKILLTAALYFIGSLIGLEFTSQNSTTSFLWPAAGLALACVFMFGSVAVIGIIIGSLFNKIILLGDNQFLLVLSALAPAIQTYVTYKILNPLFNQKFSLITEQNIVQFFLLVPLLSLTSPTLSVLALYYSQELSQTNIITTFASWWFGDTFGILIFTPVFFAFFSSQNEWVQRRISVGVSLLLLTLISVSIMQFAVNREHEQITQRLLETNRTFNTEIQNTLKQYEKNLQAINIFFLSTYHATPNEVNLFLKKLNLKKDETAYGYGWYGFADLINTKTDTQYTFHALKPYQFELDEKPINVIQNQYDECTLGSYIEIHTNLNTTQSLYRNIEASISSIDNLCASEHLGGVAYVDIDLNALFKSIIKKLNLEHISIQVIGTKNNQATPLFNQRSYDYSYSENSGFSPQSNSLITYKNTFWTLKFQGHNQYISQYTSWTTWWLFLASLLFTVTSGLGLITLTARKLHTESIVDEKSKQLQTINQRLSKQVQQQQQQQILIKMQSRILEMIAKDDELDIILTQLCLYAENQVFKGASASIMAYDDNNKQVTLAGSHHMPSDVGIYFTNINNKVEIKNQKIEKLHSIKKISDSLYLYMNDTQSYWVTPILSYQKQILGVLSISLHESRSPSQHEQQLMSATASLACISFERHHDHKQLSKLSNAVENSPNGIVITSKQGVIEYANPYFCQYIGKAEKQIKGKYLTQFVQDANDDNKQDFDWDYSLSLGESQREYMGIRPNGDIYWCKQTIASLYDKQEKSHHVLSIHQDITDEYTAHQYNKQQASHDSLTGLYNKAEFEFQLDKLLTHPDISHRHSLAFLNLDNFKTINDELGHAAGDKLLLAISQILEKQLRRTDFLARIGGDQFAIIFEQCSTIKAKTILNELINTISQYEFIQHEKTYHVGIHVGLVEINEQVVSREDIINHAYIACHLAKQDKHIHLYHNQEHDESVDTNKYNWQNILNDALKHDQFILFAQPIVNLQTALIEQYEIFLRLKSGDNKIISPSQFLNDAERLILMPKIDRWVISKTLFWMKQHSDNKTKICINISLQSLDKTLLPWLLQLIKKQKINTKLLCFEIEESLVIKDLKLTQELISSLKALGCSFSLDSFGTNISSFLNLKTIDVDYVKYSGALIKTIEHDPINRAILKSANEIAKIAGKITIAKHVESETINKIIKDISIDYSQGYYIGKPIELRKL